LVLLLTPSLVELLLGAVPGTPAGMTVSRLAGLALLALPLRAGCARRRSGPCREGTGRGNAILQHRRGCDPRPCVDELGPVRYSVRPVVLAHTGLAAWCVADLSMRTLEEKKFYRNLAFQLDTPSSILKRLANWKFGHDLIAKYPKRADP
jgi:hypothetical protein